MVRRLFLASGIALLVCLPVQAQDKGWKAGAAKVVITPEQLIWMSGYGARNKPAEGKLQDLWAKALVLEDPHGKRGVLVTMDLVGIDRGLAQNVCRQAKKKYGFERDAIILSVSHTHCGPVVRSNLITMYKLDATQQKHVADYAVFLEGKLVQLIGDASEKMAPVHLSWSIGRTTYAVNRRNNKEADVPKLRAAGQLKGPVDHDVPVLAVRDQANRLQAVVFGYACHATALSFYQWCGDHPGFAQSDLEKLHPDAIALFWAGCGGDQNPLPRRTVELAEKYGKRLAGAVQAELDRPMTPIRGSLAMTYREIDLPFGDLPTREQIVKDSLSSDHFVAARAKHLLGRIKQQGSLKETYPYPVQVWKLGSDVDWIVLGGEVVVDYALRLKKEIGPGRTWVMGYANDVMAYIPSLRVLKEGGYEGGGAMLYYGLPTAWGPQVEERIVAAVHEGVKKLRSAGR